MIYYWVILAKPFYYMQAVKHGKITFSQSEQLPVSVIVCIKNQYHDLLAFLPALLEQDYPEYEVIVVNDGVSDENENNLIRLKAQYGNLYSTYIPEDTKRISRKKLSLTLGIKAAKYDTLLFTEADSCVRTKNWISLMSRHFQNKKTLVLGFSAKGNANSFLSKFRAYDYFFINLQLFSKALCNRAYAGYGRNLAYSKKHFNEQKGFVKYLGLQQGEDDLFVNSIATKENTAIELSPDSVVFAKLTKYDWEKMKLDQAVTKCHYKPGSVAFWRIESFSRILFMISVATCIVLGYPYQFPSFILSAIALFYFLVRLFTQLFVINKTADGLNLKKNYVTIPFFDLIQSFINVYYYIESFLKKKENYTVKYEK
jgi:glycosyltransferase involved in cell wall biosynthesis